MNGSRRTGSALRRLVLAGSVALFAAAAGCASGGTPLPARPGPGLVPPGSPLASRSLPDAEAWLRHYLTVGEHDAAIQLLRRSEARERDVLLRTLQEGIILQQAGRYVESNRAFEVAEIEADRRYTQSVSRGMGSLLISDRVLAYSPSVGETVLIPYFRMQNYLALGSLDGAAVEARKANALLARMTDGRSNPCHGFGMVQYFGGLVLEAAGDVNEALVSLRLADRSLSACAERGGPRPPEELGRDIVRTARALGITEVADTVRERYGLSSETARDGWADIVILLDQGFAAHRVQQDLVVPIFRSEIAGAEGDESSASVLEAAGLITTRVLASLAGMQHAVLWDRPVWEPMAATHRYGVGRSDVAYMLRLAWPVSRLDAFRPHDLRVRLDGQPVGAMLSEDVSAGLVTELESRRAAILARMVTRGVARYLVLQELEEAAEKKGGEVLGFLTGMAGNMAVNAMERADTRSWSLLPDRIALARVRVPAGNHALTIEMTDPRGGIREEVSFGDVTLAAGERIFLTHRAWGDHPGDRDRLIRLASEVLDTEPWAVEPPPATPQPSRGLFGRLPRGGGGSAQPTIDDRIPQVPARGSEGTVRGSPERPSPGPRTAPQPTRSGTRTATPVARPDPRPAESDSLPSR